MSIFSWKWKLETLGTQIEVLGLKDGFGLFFEWAVKWPIQQFIWLNITHKPYCMHHGFASWCKDCNYPKLTKKEDILKEWEKQKKEMNQVKTGHDGMCVYCGEFKGVVRIPDPNDGLGDWMVCVECDKVIKAQQKLAFGHFLLDKSGEGGISTEPAKDIIDDANEELKNISEESFNEPFTLILKRKEDMKK